MQEMPKARVQSLGQEDLLEKGMATHSNIVAWRSPWMEEPGRLQSRGRKKSDVTEVTSHGLPTSVQRENSI